MKEQQELPLLCVCGAGTMGGGIGQVAAAAGFSTIIYDLSEEVLLRTRQKVEADLQKIVDRQKLAAGDKAAILGRMLFTTDLGRCTGPVVIEAIIEKMDAKVALLGQLAEINGPGTLLASNTSSLSLTEMARQVPCPERVVGLHFFNPAPLMKLVEVVATPFTTPENRERTISLARQLGKTPVACTDAPGFIVNRVARPFYLEALRLAEEGVASFEVIDRLLEAAGFKMGPFRLMDLIGNDINYAVSCSVYDRLNRPERLRPSPFQQVRVEKGELGRKTGKGYYAYK